MSNFANTNASTSEYDFLLGPVAIEDEYSIEPIPFNPGLVVQPVVPFTDYVQEYLNVNQPTFEQPTYSSTFTESVQDTYSGIPSSVQDTYSGNFTSSVQDYQGFDSFTGFTGNPICSTFSNTTPCSNLSSCMPYAAHDLPLATELMSRINQDYANIQCESAATRDLLLSTYPNPYSNLFDVSVQEKLHDDEDKHLYRYSQTCKDDVYSSVWYRNLIGGNERDGGERYCGPCDQWHNTRNHAWANHQTSVHGISAVTKSLYPFPTGVILDPKSQKLKGWCSKCNEYVHLYIKKVGTVWTTWFRHQDAHIRKEMQDRRGGKILTPNNPRNSKKRVVEDTNMTQNMSQKRQCVQPQFQETQAVPQVEIQAIQSIPSPQVEIQAIPTPPQEIQAIQHVEENIDFLTQLPVLNFTSTTSTTRRTQFFNPQLETPVYSEVQEVAQVVTPENSEEMSEEQLDALLDEALEAVSEEESEGSNVESEEEHDEETNALFEEEHDEEVDALFEEQETEENEDEENSDDSDEEDSSDEDSDSDSDEPTIETHTVVNSETASPEFKNPFEGSFDNYDFGALLSNDTF